VTLRTNARIAGFAYYLYLAAGIGSLAAGHRPLSSVLSLFESLSALLLGVSLYAITRDEDRDLAMLAMLCRVVEAVPGDGAFFFAVGSTIFCWLLLRGRMIPAALAWLGVAASGMMVVLVPLQRGGVISGQDWSSPVTWLLWLPMLIFELAFGAWLLARGVEPSAKARLRESLA
jgi:Domain of unknown function (DUF4386)